MSALRAPCRPDGTATATNMRTDGPQSSTHALKSSVELPDSAFGIRLSGPQRPIPCIPHTPCPNRSFPFFCLPSCSSLLSYFGLFHLQEIAGRLMFMSIAILPVSPPPFFCLFFCFPSPPFSLSLSLSLSLSSVNTHAADCLFRICHFLILTVILLAIAITDVGSFSSYVAGSCPSSLQILVEGDYCSLSMADFRWKSTHTAGNRELFLDVYE